MNFNQHPPFPRARKGIDSPPPHLLKLSYVNRTACRRQRGTREGGRRGSHHEASGQPTGRHRPGLPHPPSQHQDTRTSSPPSEEAGLRQPQPPPPGRTFRRTARVVGNGSSTQITAGATRLPRQRWSTLFRTITLVPGRFPKPTTARAPMDQLIIDDWRAETQTRLFRSALYRALKEQCQASPAGNQVLQLVDDATSYAYHRTKTIVRHMGEYTLHDGDHLFRVLYLMERLLGHEKLQMLTAPELMLLILSAFFHDIGMAPDERDVLAWRKYWDRAPAFADSRELREHAAFQRFCSGRPGTITLIDQLLAQGKQSTADIAKSYLISDYIRSTHADRAREIIKADWLGKIRYRDTDLTVEFAAICYSHNTDASSVLEFDKRHLCGPDVWASLPLVAALLRLADLLDFDAKRTPAILLSHLFVRHPVSIAEWNKHRAIEAWAIGTTGIQFQAKCGHPAIEASIHAFCDMIDSELGACGNVFSSLNDFHRSIGRELVVQLPFKVDRSKIATRKTIDNQPEYLFRLTQFTLSKAQVIDLLMGTKLYGNPDVALRELLQNSIDACLLRGALEESWTNPYIPEISVRYYSESGEDILEVHDNGIGMDQHVIDTYYSKVGSSFYQSPDFFELRSQTKSRFTPTSRFGIGILSCFMVADSIVVDTRKVYEPHRSSDPISVSIDGQDSIFWIRGGTRDKPGTSTRLYLRAGDNPWARMSDSQFVAAVEAVVPNPPFSISIETKSCRKTRDHTSFQRERAESLRDGSWEDHENIRLFSFDLDMASNGIVGSVVVAVLEHRGFPVTEIEMASKVVNVDDEEFVLEKRMTMRGGAIHLHTTSITIDDNGDVERSELSGRLAESRSKLSLHGIEVPTSLFPPPWSLRQGQPRFRWPLPLLAVVDVCGERDLDLNSSRTQILLTDRWVEFEELLAKEIASGIARQVAPEYWARLKRILAPESTRPDLFDDIVVCAT